MNKTTSILLALAAFFAVASAECPNACSAHGKCGAYDMCTCFRNWMSNDCSERICQFGIAHVDSPKGDLDASSGALSGPSTTVIPNNDMYPYGTTEQYPAVTDIDGNVLTNTAHEYRECSNKGICDRTAGTCTCFEGYEGAACQRASCPSNANGVCSGHGTCQTIAEIAANDFGNIYQLWDESSTMGCVCDGGYSGADCSQRQCKVGVDPYYKDNNATIRYSNVTYEFYLMSSSNSIYGNYSLIFYDSFGEDWQTEPITIDASCTDLTAALEAIPNNVVPANSVRCYKHTVSSSDHGISMYLKTKYTLAFPQNPGKLQQLDVNIMLDGNRPTLYSDETTSTLGWHIYNDGYTGENIDYVPDRCFDVLVTLENDGTAAGFRLASLTTTEAKLLKKCLGDSNGDSTDNVEVYNWDHGASTSNSILTNPHLIKLQEATQYQVYYRTDINGVADFDPVLQKMPKSYLCDTSASTSSSNFGYGIHSYCANHDAPGFYAILYFDGTDFRILTNPSMATYYDTTTPFYVYTTTGYLQLVSPDVKFYTSESSWSNSVRSANYFTSMLHSANTTSQSAYMGDVSCETNPKGTYSSLDCLSKGDHVMVFGGDLTTNSMNTNPIYHNMYQVEKIGFVDRPETQLYSTTPANRQEIILDSAINAQFISGLSGSTTASVYKFYPPTGYNYAQPCAGRGICNGAVGLCECFPGYAGDDCSCQNCGLTV